ncbi:hypothetical protein C8J57DRAFT_1720525 [Mycena rebaudengoi]|nr:hypothetical protein C8J57DRAFT_1720525 [Mycena rebaudengoi]
MSRLLPRTPSRWSASSSRTSRHSWASPSCPSRTRPWRTQKSGEANILSSRSHEPAVTPGLFLSLVGGVAIRTTTQGLWESSAPSVPSSLVLHNLVHSVCLIVVHARCSISRIFMEQLICAFGSAKA